VLTAAMALLTAARAGSGASMAAAPLGTAAGLTGVLATSYFAMIMAMVLGVTIATGEYRHATATLTHLATPHRTQVIAAKAVTAFAAGLIFGLAGAAITTGIGLAAAHAKDYHIILAATTITRYGVGATLGSGLLAVSAPASGR
jgi:ABC-2 type transport system permease protein